MARLHVSRLDRDMRKRIESGSYVESEIEAIRGILQHTVDARMKAARGVAVLFVAIDAFAAWAEIFANPNSSLEILVLTLGALVALELIVWFLAWALQVGILKCEFNRAVERGYPQLMHCRLQ